MALRRYSVTVVDEFGGDWYTLHTDDIREALNDARDRRQQDQAVYIYDNQKDRIVDEKFALAANVDPIFRSIFDSFLSYAVNDTVNNGDTLRVEQERDRDLENEVDRGFRDEGVGTVPVIKQEN